MPLPSLRFCIVAGADLLPAHCGCHVCHVPTLSLHLPSSTPLPFITVAIAFYVGYVAVGLPVYVDLRLRCVAFATVTLILRTLRCSSTIGLSADVGYVATLRYVVTHRLPRLHVALLPLRLLRSLPPRLR